MRRALAGPHTVRMGGSTRHWGGRERPETDEGEPLAGQQVETLGVADVVLSILKAQPEMPWASAASVWRQRRGDVVYVRVTLLERPPPAQPGEEAAGAGGRTQVIAEFAAQRLGGDLVTAFGAKDVIILQ